MKDTIPNIEYHGQQDKQSVIDELVRISMNNPNLYIYFSSAFNDGWFCLQRRQDRYACGTQSGKWIGGYAYNGQFKTFSKKNIIWEQHQGLLAE
jgi:hypothetical protein